MRNLFARAVSGFVLATVIAGSASAAGVPFSNQAQQPVTNPALQAQLERDASPSEAWLHRSPLGQVVVPGSAQSAGVMQAEQEGHMHLSRD